MSKFTIICVRCDRPLIARREWVGREVQCPHCASALRVPPAPPDDRPVRAETPGMRPRLGFNFGCPRCQTLLEAHSGMCGQPGTCPTCAAHLIVPHLDRESGIPEAAGLLDVDPQDPTPLHAYAASGDQAPRIGRRSDGTLEIECPRCGETSAVDANSCRNCGAPFTIEAAPTTSSRRVASWASAALVLGILSLPLFVIVLPGLLAIVLGAMSLRGAGPSDTRLGVVGLILGLLSLAGGVAFWMFA